MSIHTNVRQAVQAHGVLERIGQNEIRDAKLLLRIGLLKRALDSVAASFNEARRAALLASGAVAEGQSVVLRPPEREPEESAEAFANRQKEHTACMIRLDEALNALLNEKISIECEPLPFDLVESAMSSGTPLGLRPNDIALLGPFLKEQGNG